MDERARRMHRIDPAVAQRLVDAGLDVPAKVRRATDTEIREALKGRGSTAAFAAVRKAYPKRK